MTTPITKQQRAQQKNQRPACVWLTGLPSAGKSTIALALDQRLTALGRHTFVLDGDVLRTGLNSNLGFSPQDREENIRRAGEVAKLMVDAGLIVICAFISPYRAERRRVRASLAAGEFLEVYLDVPVSVCEARDPKGNYKRARAGLLHDFTGIDAPYEVPEAPELRLNTAQCSLEECVDVILAALDQR